jgi:hypothetical protein
MLTIVMAMLGNLLTIYPGGGGSFWNPPPPADIIVRRGQTVVIYNVRAYKTYPTCMSIPPVPVDVWPRPQLGAIATSPGAMVGPGPCGAGPYAIQTVTYTAGPIAGAERFQLYFYMTDGKRDQRAVNVIVR